MTPKSFTLFLTPEPTGHYTLTPIALDSVAEVKALCEWQMEVELHQPLWWVCGEWATEARAVRTRHGGERTKRRGGWWKSNNKLYLAHLDKELQLELQQTQRACDRRYVAELDDMLLECGTWNCGRASKMMPVLAALGADRRLSVNCVALPRYAESRAAKVAMRVLRKQRTCTCKGERKPHRAAKYS